MIGKKNIAFGFLYLVLTASLGPYMIVTQFPAVAQSQATKQAKMSALQQAQSNGFLDENLDTMTPKQIAEANTGAILALSASLNAQAPIDAIKGGPHAHGNLEALLNVVAGIVLCFLALPILYKQILSWLFIGGAVLHSGMWYLAVVPQWGWAISWTTGPLAVIGPVLVLAGFGLMGIAVILGFRGEIVRD
jgi:hypothetical protein